ncbi:PGAP1-like protein-domain-containing protein [Melanogaster broomeanus]|nr:PGAP1-like protein-domain-containing protein [Melanogaster broomeanus]
MTRNAPTILGVFTLLAACTVYRAASDIPRRLSPQGCRMSWMSPSYLLQSEFNTSWTPLASRYSLWLYREVGWEPHQAMGTPVLFIPGNAGSSHQVRSIASSAARQYFSSPFVVSDEFSGRRMKPLDFYAVEFNEDLSAFHGPTLDSQIAYASAAVTYILARYPPGTEIIVIGHSMGGVVGTALLPAVHISALITMSTPHTLPPARFDARVEAIYVRNRDVLARAATPILSLCGGATDMMVPSESCVLPEGEDGGEGEDEGGGYRRTVFTSALEGAWTGVGHREMVWCHQVRWRVARAALELGGAASAGARGGCWTGGGQAGLEEGTYEVLPEGEHLVLRYPRPRGARTYLVPVPNAEDEDEEDGRAFVLYVSAGTISGVSPHHATDLHVSVQLCVGSSADADVACSSLAPTTLKLLPSPIPGKPFPVPDEGSDESEGVVLFEGEVPRGAKGDGDRRRWVVGGFDGRYDVESLIFGGVKISLPHSGNSRLRLRITLARLPANALLVYRLVPQTAGDSSCAAPSFYPLLMHTSHASEIHYYPLTSDKPVSLHTHSSAPYVPPLRLTPSLGFNLTIYSAESSCNDITELSLAVDWWATAGRIGTRYPTTLLSWGIGIVSLLLFQAWSAQGQQLSVGELLGMFVRRTMPTLMAVSAVVALLPVGPEYHLGIAGEMGMGAASAVLAVFLVGIAAGVVCVSWWVLVGLMRRPEDVGLRRSTVVSMALVLLLIFLFVPWQVAFLGCWVIQLFNCAATSRPKPYPGSVPTLASTPTESIPLRERIQDGDKADDEGELSVDDPTPSSLHARAETLKPPFTTSEHQNMSILLLMTWLLPLAAPVLAVWVRTLQTAGYTAPFSGDHNVLKVAPVLWLVEYLGRGRVLDTRTRRGTVSARWGFVVVAGVAFLGGGRRAYLVYDAANVQMGFLLLCQVASWYSR